MNKEIEELIDEYKLNAAKHGDTIKEGNYKVGNKCYDKLMIALNRIKEYGDEGNEALLSLTDDENDSVRCWSACHSLKYNEEKAVKTLEEIQKQKGIISLSAEMTLSEWRKGNL